MSASTVAEDKACGVKRKHGIVTTIPSKSAKISFVPQGYEMAKFSASTYAINDNLINEEIGILDSNDDTLRTHINNEEKNDEKKSSQVIDANEYLKDMLSIQCLDIRYFHDGMFNTDFGRIVLLIRPWTSKLCNIQCKF